MKEVDPAALIEAMRSLPFASIDLVITDERNRVLVGKRVNEPAKGTYFVPGGRIWKGETLDVAFRRIAKAELGATGWGWADAGLLGVFTHHYPTNAFGVAGLPTDYVVVACYLDGQDLDLKKLPRDQHTDYQWADRETTLDVHPNTRAYFPLLATLAMSDRQYELLNARRDAANGLVWQTPIVGLTGLAFIFLVLLQGGTPSRGRWIAAILAVLVSVAVIQLTAKQRFTELSLTREAHRLERVRGWYELNRRRNAPSGYLKYSSVRIWTVLFALTGIGAVVAVLLLTAH